ncbi:hypothetical protein EOA75_03925 [Mesorhizobium sp. M1A.F.Ca.IN.022.07.1.1]|uniref:hypothetical protein n=1 Tax=Mesorhizobium sp. M1A.F.Ca.IN.022.07.1.1 TaxID=2496767 RepID=UPI000FCC8156|nr:hypothetical protein [Mesorhizobium sp. M1A.F.Ca.IN.022.07.1.1]RUV97360.1 hypothetical protein EOA75_03925 [Mesorhizobium sp. M1A.F.Ca.IN.022.07.1.1]
MRQAPSPKGFVTLGKFHLQVTDDVTIFDCSLVKAPDGNILLYGPSQIGGAATLSVSRDARLAIIDMALSALGMELHERRAA